VDRDGDTVVARTMGNRPGRVIVAGHLDTVPIKDNVPGRLAEGPSGARHVWGRGSVDQKGGLAAMLHLACRLDNPATELTWVFYDHEEVDADLSGLGRVYRHHPEWLAGDFAVLTEPTDADIEGGCNGTLRVKATVLGRAAHSARAWMGLNAIHQAAPVLEVLADYWPATVEVDGLSYRESLNAVGIEGGIAGNVIPDRCVVTVNYRFAPDKTPEAALAHVRDVLEGYQVDQVDVMGGARPGLDHPAAAALVQAAKAQGAQVKAKYGWTDVARFWDHGVPAVNFGPGDPNQCHTDQEACPVAQIETVARVLGRWLQGQ
jgi:succinyl-diaminopimelate desuccinylase